MNWRLFKRWARDKFEGFIICNNHYHCVDRVGCNSYNSNSDMVQCFIYFSPYGKTFRVKKQNYLINEI